jgi:hypothetical protein
MTYTSRFMKIMPKVAQSKTSAKYLKAGLFLSLILLFFLLLLETGGYLAASLGLKLKFSPLYYSRYFNNPSAKFNKATGYTWVPGENRIMKTMNGELIYDQIFHTNNMGFTSRRDYSYKRDPDKTLRVLVFGDSFTDSVFLDTPWPNRLQEILDSGEQREKKIQIYSFALDGAGLINWHQTFFNLVLPNFDFDAVIIASFTGDLTRDFFVRHINDKQSVYIRFEQLPESEAEFFEDILPGLKATSWVKDDQYLDHLKQVLESGGYWVALDYDFYITKYLIGKWPIIKARLSYLLQGRNHQDERHEEHDPSLNGLAKKEMETFSPGNENHNSWKADRLKEFLDYFRKNNIPVILSPVPVREAAIQRNHQKTDMIHQSFIGHLAKEYGFEFFDGYKAFSDQSDERITNHLWLKYDGHWG